MASEDFCNTSLVLRLGLFPSSSSPKYPANPIEPSLALSLNSGETYHHHHQILHAQVKKVDSDDHLYRQESAASSFSNVSVKREREIVSSEEFDTERVSLDEDDYGSNGRKKLRLSKAQSALLEESFNLHSTLNPKQKQDLSRELKLTPRQVEVWFQNRRARTKLKQTEIDCEVMKKCCEKLTEENRRLQKELKALKSAHAPLYMQLPAATLTMCPSCERVGGGGAAVEIPSPMAPKAPFYNPFSNPSAAC